jgi:hypothetical protein
MDKESADARDAILSRRYIQTIIPFRVLYKLEMDICHNDTRHHASI